MCLRKVIANLEGNMKDIDGQIDWWNPICWCNSSGRTFYIRVIRNRHYYSNWSLHITMLQKAE